MGRITFRQVVILFCTVVCLFYLTYRGLFTLNLSTPYAVFASIFLFLGELFGVVCVLSFFLQVWDTTQPPQKPILPGRTVDVFVPTYNEDPAILRATLEACQRMDYPHRTYLCDDGGTDARCNDTKDLNKATSSRERAALLKAICEELGVTYITRPDNRHAKAGNLNYAFEKTDGEFIIIFDADHVPEPQFISRLIGYFEDEKLAFVQTPHAFYNFDSFQARHDHEKQHYWEEGHLFYNVIQPGRNRWGCPIFAGAAAMFRRTALVDVGYIATETITEDMHTGLRMHAKGWKSLAISERMIVGQAAPDVTTFHTQRLRWGEGNLSIMAYDNPLTTRGLTFAQRLCYFGSMIHWAGGIFKLPIYLTPILMMFTGVPPVNQFTWSLALITLLYLFVAIFGVRYVSEGYISLLNAELFCMINFWTSVQATLKATFWRKFQSFIVTAKRGRQSKSIWPFIKPQAYLAAISVVALVWGWGRCFLGISQDWNKPIIPSFWIVFHMMLIWQTIRLALRPDDKRYAYRHAVNLPVAYEYQGIETDGKVIRQVRDVKLEELSATGVTVDMSEGGIGIITYARLPVGALLRLTVWGRGEVLECVGQVRWVAELSQGIAGTAKGYRCGVQFRNLAPKQLDAVNRITLHYAVARMYSEYEAAHKRPYWHKVAERVGRWLRPRRFAIRYTYHLPLIINLGDQRGTTYYAVTEDVSRTNIAALMPTHLAIGSTVNFDVPTPLGRVRGQAKVIRGETRTYAARDYQFAVFELVHFEEQGRVTLEALINPRENHQLTPVLKPRRQVRQPGMTKAAALFLASVLPVSALAMGGFRYLYRDDFFLKDVLAQETPPDQDQVARIDRIYTDTIDDGHPSTDRLSLLMRNLTRMDRKEELSQVALLIAPRDRGNLDLQLALAQALDNTKDYERAESQYQELLRRARDESVATAQRRELLLGAARSSVHAGNLPRAVERFRELMELSPNDRTLRNEFAGVLLSNDRADEAAALFQGGEPDLDGRLLLVAIFARQEKYDAAEAEARRIVALRPGDLQAEKLLADVLSWKRGFAQSRAIYERLARINGDDPDLEVRLAQVALWSKNYDDALTRYQAMIDRGSEKQEILQGFIDAASSAETLGETQKRIALNLFDRLLTASTNDAVMLARLAWVLQRLNEAEKASILLDRAVALKPTDPAIRKQLFGALVTAGRLQDALEGMDPERMDIETRRYLVSLHLKNKNLPAAAAECRRILQDAPEDTKTLRLLADVLSWNKQYRDSLTVFDQLRQKLPDDTEIPLRIAEVTMWSGEVDKALVLLLFQTLLEKDFQQPAAQRGFVDAAAAVKGLTEPQRQLIIQIYDGVKATESKEVPFLTRLAWVLHQEGQEPKAERLLDIALRLRPQDPAARKELAGVLAAVGKNDVALKLYEGLTLTLDDRVQLVGLLSAAKNYEAAAAQCRVYLREKPNDVRARRLLADVLSWDGKYAESLALLDGLVEENGADDSLRLRQAEVCLWSGNLDRALPLYRRMLELKFDQPKLWNDFVNAAAGVGTLTDADTKLAVRIAEKARPGERDEVAFLTRLSSVLVRGKEPARAVPLLDRALALKPTEAAARKELAGALGAAGRHKQALALLDDLPVEAEDRYQLASLHAGSGDHDAALAQVKQLLDVNPGDRKARRLQADVLTWAKRYPDALKELEELSREEPNDESLKVKLAEVTLWAGQRDKALGLFQALLEKQLDQPAVWPGFISACSSAEKLTPAQTVLVSRIADRVITRADDPALLSRLAWVLHRAGETARAATALDRAVALKPTDPALRRELSGVLAAAGRAKEALALYDGLNLVLEDRFRLAGVHCTLKNFADAERECRAILRERPRDTQARRLLADVLSWNKKYTESLALLNELVRDAPEDELLKLRLAEVMLWSGEQVTSLALFQAILEEKFDQPAVWPSYVNAAAAAEALTAPQLELIRNVADELGKTSNDPALVTRLAWVFHRAKEPARVEELLDRAISLKPDDGLLQRELAGVLAAAGRGKDALALYKALTLGRDDRHQLVNIHATVGDFDAAITECRALLREKPGDAKARRLLADILTWGKKHKEAMPLYEQLVRDNPKDEALKARLAEVTLWSGDPDAALVLLRGLLEGTANHRQLWPAYINAAAGAKALTETDARLARQFIDQLNPEEIRDGTLLIRLASVLTRVGDTQRVAALLDRVMAMKPTDAATRKELAGVLGAAGRFKEALALFDGLTLTAEDRYQLAGLHAGAGDHDAALDQVKQLLDQTPNDRKIRRLEADVLSWAKRYPDALKALDLLLKDEPNDDGLKLRRAEVTLWSGERDKALGLYQSLLESQFDRPGAWSGYVAAAASVEKLTAAQWAIVRKIDKQAGETATDPALLSRLAWLLHREDDKPRAQKLLDRALALKPAEPVLKRELAGVLAATGRHKDALALYDGLPLLLEDRYRLAGLYSAVKEYLSAAEQCRAILKEKPADRDARRMLADSLSWAKEYKESLALFDDLIREATEDADLRVRRAEVTLWSGDYDKAASLFHTLLEARFDQPKLWPAYVDAAASAKTLPIAHASLALRVADKTLESKPEKATTLSRLAWVLVRLNNKEKASALLDLALAMKPTDPVARRELAGVFAALGKRTLALEMYTGLELDLDDRYRLAEIYAAEKKLDDAERELRLVHKARPNDHRATQFLGSVLLWKGDYAEARKLFDGLKAVDPDNRELPVKLAQLALWSGQYDDALDRFRKLLEAEPNNADNQRGYIDAAASAKKVDASDAKWVLHVHDAMKKDLPNDAVLLARMGWVLRRVGEKDRALDLLKRALALNPKERSVRTQLAELLYEMGRYDEAEKHFATLLGQRGSP